MPKDCGCNKSEKTVKGDDKPERKQIWVYEKPCKDTLKVPNNSYVGKNGFAYYLINNDKTQTEYKAAFKFSNLNPNEIVYYVILNKVTKVSYNEKKNTVKKYLDCVTQYVYKKTLQQPIIVDIINKIGNGIYDLIPDDSNEFNSIVIKKILDSVNSTLKTGETKVVAKNIIINQVGKEYGSPSCGTSCPPTPFTACKSSCPYCSNQSGGCISIVN